MTCHIGSTATEESHLLQNTVQTCSVLFSSPKKGASWTKARGRSTHRDVALGPAFLRRSGFLDGLCTTDSGCFGKSFSRAGLPSKRGAGVFFKQICWARWFPLLCMNLISVEREADLHLLFSPRKFDPASSSGGSKPQWCRTTSLHSAQSLSHPPPQKRGKPPAATGSSSIAAASAVNPHSSQAPRLYQRFLLKLQHGVMRMKYLACQKVSKQLKT